MLSVDIGQPLILGLVVRKSAHVEVRMSLSH
jgi:hypothetical protein